MQKHQEWLQNRSYEQHLQSIKKIKTKKNTSIPIFNKSKKYLCKNITPYQCHIKQTQPSKSDKQNLHDFQQYEQENFKFDQNSKYHKVRESQFLNQQPQTQKNQHFDNLSENDVKQNRNHNNDHKYRTGRTFFPSYNNSKNLSVGICNKKSPMNRDFSGEERNSTAYMTLKQKQLLLNNFLLGKRIIETTPVICKKKLDLEYKKHKQLLKSRTTRRLNHQTSNYRLRKLQEHNQKIYKITDQQRIQYNLHRKYVLNLKIQSIEIFKYKFSSFENIILSMKIGNKESDEKNQEQTNSINLNKTKKKQTRQVSECIPSSILTSYNFFFSLTRNTIELNLPIIIEIKNVKSLNVISVGTFSFQLNHKLDGQSENVKLYNFGKLIGNVKFHAQCGRKEQFISH